jgi:hypothetical protein
VSLRSVKEARGQLCSMGFLVPLQADQMRLNRFGCPVVVNLRWVPTTESALRTAESTTKSAPLRTQKSSFLRKRSDHQKPGRAPDPSGVCDEKKKKPSMRDVKIGDLENPNRLAALFVDAERRGMVKRCEADQLAFFAAAEHSRRVGQKNPPGLFASLVRTRYYGYIAQGDEDAARRTIAARERAGFQAG